MANVLLESYQAASSLYNHVVFNDRTQQFERAGKRHALATFFGTADAKAKNEATLKAIRDFMAIEREQVFGVAGQDAAKDYFSGVKGSCRIGSAAVNRIIAKIRDDIAATPSAQKAAKDRILQEFLSDADNYRFLDSCIAEGGDPRDMAETMARVVLDAALRRNPVADNAGLERFRREANLSLHSAMGRLAVFVGHSRSDAQDLGDMCETFRACGDGDGCLVRFLSALFEVVATGKGQCDEVFVSRFLSVMEQEKGAALIKEGRFSGKEIGDAFNSVSSMRSCVQAGRFLAALELKLNAADMFGGFARTEILEGLSAAFVDVREENVGDFLSVVADIMRHDPQAAATSESVAGCARTVNGALQLLRGMGERHPDALKDGVGLMKDLHAPVDAGTVKQLLGMAEKLTGGILDPNVATEESVDANLASICFAGNGIGSIVEKEEKNWIVAKFVLSSAPKVDFPSAENAIGEAETRQRDCAMRVMSSSVNLQAFYSRVGGALCGKYARALEYLAGQYRESGMLERYRADAGNAYNVSRGLKEKYDVANRTAAKPGKYRTEISCYAEFGGARMEQAKEAAGTIDGILKGERIFAGDKIRVKHLAMQHVAFLCGNGAFPDGETVRRVTQRYCRMAKWGGALLDRLADVPAERRKTVILALEAYGCSSSAKLFDMIAGDPEVFGPLERYIDDCERRDAHMLVPEGTSVSALEIRAILAGGAGWSEEFGLALPEGFALR